MFEGYKTGISWMFFEHCEQADHHTAMQRHLEKVEAIEVLHCTKFVFSSSKASQNIYLSNYQPFCQSIAISIST